jgi:hypothetical protein
MCAGQDAGLPPLRNEVVIAFLKAVERLAGLGEHGFLVS